MNKTDKAKEKAGEVYEDVKAGVKKEVHEISDTIKKNPKKTMAIVAYFIFFVPLLTKDRKDEFVWYHTKQGIGLFLFASILRGIIAALGGPPYTSFGSSLSSLLIPIAHIILIILIVMGVLNASGGKTKPLPFIGKYAEKIF